jgi:hypothetical protein
MLVLNQVKEDIGMKWLCGIVIVLLAALFVGCAQTEQARKVEISGFLGDYSILHKGKEGEALLIYINPNIDFAVYDKVIFDPVTVWRGEGSKLYDVPKADLQRLANYLHTAIVTKLREDYEIVNKPGPNVLRIRAAITEAGKSNVGLNIFSTIVPQAILLSGAKKLATGTNSFVGAASVEGKITDSNTGEILAAMVDRRAGGKSLKGAMNAWNDVEQAFQYWAERLSQRLREMRAGRQY